jgi:NSS family neurotransmitter:Na+ symporter
MCDISLTVGGALMCVFISRQWGIEKMDAELVNGNETYMQSRTRSYLHFTIRWVAPVLLGVLSVLIIVEKFFGVENLM